MGVLEMTRVSYFFAVMAVVFGGVSIGMYFILDIRRCWRIVRGTHSVAVRKKVPSAIVSNAESPKCNEMSNKTEKLMLDKTEALLMFEETAPLETMTLVQDIVMMDIGKECR